MDFQNGFCHHTTRQDHHAEFWWASVSDQFPATPELRRQMAQTARKMNTTAVVEMVVDWHAAEWSYGGSIPTPGKP